MKLFYAPGTCSLAPHIVALELSLPLTLEKVDIRKKIYSGGDYYQLNPKGSVPALQLDDGQILTEGVVLLQYIGDLKPDSHLLPRVGSLDRYRVQEWLNYVATEVHKTFSILFGLAGMVQEPTGQEQLRKSAQANLGTKFKFLSQHVKPFLMGEHFTVADAYLYTTLRWAKPMGIDLADYPEIQAYFERVGSRPKVQEAIKAEGLKL